MFRLAGYIVIGFLTLGLSAASYAQPSVLHPSGLPLPRFVSLKPDKVNMRVGPGRRYPIRYVYTRKALPVEIIEEFAHWRKIRDPDNASGWVHKNLLSGARTCMIIGDNGAKGKPLYKKPDHDARIMVRMQKGFIGTLIACLPDWCKMQAKGYKGWVNKADIWGAYRDEVFEK
jgi:SH3-like domain-containing protein